MPLSSRLSIYFPLAKEQGKKKKIQKAPLEPIKVGKATLGTRWPDPFNSFDVTAVEMKFFQVCRLSIGSMIPVRLDSVFHLSLINYRISLPELRGFII